MIKITSFQDRLAQKWSNQIKTDFSAMRLSWCDFEWPTCYGQNNHADLGTVIGLDIWRQITHQFAGSSKTRSVSLIKQIMSLAECNVDKSNDVLQQGDRWLECISKYEVVTGEKVTDTVKITFVLQNVKKAISLSLCMSVAVILLLGHKFIPSSPTTSTMQCQQTHEASISSP